MSDGSEDHIAGAEPGPSDPSGTAGQADAPDAPPAGQSEAPWWRQPYAGQPAGDAGQPAGGYAAGPPQSPTGYGPYGPYGAYGAYGHWSGAPWGWGQQGGWSQQAGWGQPTAPQPQGRGRRKGVVAVVAAGLTLLALLVGVGIGYGVWNGGNATPTAGRLIPGGTARSTATSTTVTRTPSTGKISSATGAPSDIATIAAKVTPGLVDINTVLRYETEEAAGTGMVLTSTGKVLTNNHVIEGSTKITATDLGNGKVYAATVLGYTRTQDVAVIQLKGASGLKTVRLGNSSTVKIGQAIVGIGNAGGTGGQPSAAGGSVTKLDQAITASDRGSLGTTTEHLTGLIETNADIQPGDSGGPLVTTSGKVVGMDTAASAAQGYSFQGAATGQGYSIPINEAISIAHQIIAGRPSATVHIGGTPFLGVYVQAAGAPTAVGGLGFGSTVTSTGTTSPTSGAIVQQVIAGTPAQTSGLAPGDVITNVGGTPVTSPSGLTKIMMRYHPGDTVRVVWTTRSGQTQSAAVTLASGPAD